MENAEVLEMTVKKVEDILKNRSQGTFNTSWDSMVDTMTQKVADWTDGDTGGSPGYSEWALEGSLSKLVQKSTWKSETVEQFQQATVSNIIEAAVLILA